MYLVSSYVMILVAASVYFTWSLTYALHGAQRARVTILSILVLCDNEASTMYGNPVLCSIQVKGHVKQTVAATKVMA